MPLVAIHTRSGRQYKTACSVVYKCTASVHHVCTKHGPNSEFDRMGATILGLYIPLMLPVHVYNIVHVWSASALRYWNCIADWVIGMKIKLKAHTNGHQCTCTHKHQCINTLNSIETQLFTAEHIWVVTQKLASVFDSTAYGFAAATSTNW